MFRVVEKDTGKHYNVFDITYDQCGYPKFLIYDDNQWIQRSAKYFAPVMNEEYIIKGDKKYRVVASSSSIGTLLHS